MFKPLAALTGVILILSVTSALAVSTSIPVKKSPGGGDEVSDTAGEPFYPNGKPATRTRVPTDPTTTGSTPDPDHNPKWPDGHGTPNNSTSSTASTGNGDQPACGDELGGLKKVRAGAVRSVGYGDSIDVVPLCIGRTLKSEQESIGGLRAPIAQNETLMGALKAAGGYSAEHVVGIQLNGEKVVLYVH